MLCRQSSRSRLQMPLDVQADGHKLRHIQSNLSPVGKIEIEIKIESVIFPKRNRSFITNLNRHSTNIFSIFRLHRQKLRKFISIIFAIFRPHGRKCAVINGYFCPCRRKFISILVLLLWQEFVHLSTVPRLSLLSRRLRVECERWRRLDSSCIDVHTGIK